MGMRLGTYGKGGQVLEMVNRLPCRAAAAAAFLRTLALPQMREPRTIMALLCPASLKGATWLSADSLIVGALPLPPFSPPTFSPFQPKTFFT